MDPSLVPFAWAAAAALVIGICKGGFGGVGTVVAVPIMSLGADPAFTLGVLLPILMLADVVSVSSHHRDADWRAVLQAVPGALVGVIVGATLLASVDGQVILVLIGLISIVFAVHSFARGRMSAPANAAGAGWSIGASRLASVFGAAAGLTSTLAHAGGPPIHMHYLARGYSPVRFVATASVFMAAMNVMKVVPYLLVGNVGLDTLGYSVTLVPFVLAAAFVGIGLARRIDRARFAMLVNTLMLVVGVKLLVDGLGVLPA